MRLIEACLFMVISPCCPHGFFSAAIQKMKQGENGMGQDHARSDSTHDHSDFFPHGWLVAVYAAVSACGLPLLKRAVVKTLAGIMKQLCAFCTEMRFIGIRLPVGMVFPAKPRNHHGNGFFFPRHARMLFFHGVHLYDTRRVAGQSLNIQGGRLDGSMSQSAPRMSPCNIHILHGEINILDSAQVDSILNVTQW